uniref:Uncharacterized protein n=1 Tax=Vannella robusta TaxID=1487602 RepID=A0A7S4HYD5_9EUKA
MQASRRVLNTVTPRWHSFFHKSDQWKGGCACSNHGVLWFTDTIYCLTQRWGTARAEFNQVLNFVKTNNITLGDVWRTTLFGLQGFLIFHVGTRVGAGSLTGYYHGPPISEVWPDKNAGHH